MVSVDTDPTEELTAEVEEELKGTHRTVGAENSTLPRGQECDLRCEGCAEVQETIRIQTSQTRTQEMEPNCHLSAQNG